MYKVIFILSVVSVLTGCSVFQQSVRSENNRTGVSDWNSLEQLVVEQNITSANFFIRKARIEVISEDVKENFLATIKFLYPDTFLVRLRSMTGIEAARIFFTEDTILINDRINRKILFGKPDKAGRKYGITPEILPVLLGDFISESRNQRENECIDGIAVVNTAISGRKIRYIIDCEKGKVISASRESSNDNKLSVIKFGKFIRIADVYYPSDIGLDYSEMRVRIKIDKIEYPWNGIIEFIHGSNYELIELL